MWATVDRGQSVAGSFWIHSMIWLKGKVLSRGTRSSNKTVAHSGSCNMDISSEYTGRNGFRRAVATSPPKTIWKYADNNEGTKKSASLFARVMDRLSVHATLERTATGRIKCMLRQFCSILTWSYCMCARRAVVSTIRPRSSCWWIPPLLWPNLLIPTLCCLLLRHPKKPLSMVTSLLSDHTACVCCPKFSGHVFYDGTTIYACNQYCFTLALLSNIFLDLSRPFCSTWDGTRTMTNFRVGFSTPSKSMGGRTGQK